VLAHVSLSIQTLVDSVPAIQAHTGLLESWHVHELLSAQKHDALEISLD